MFNLLTSCSLKSNFITTHPASQPPGKHSKKQDRAIYQKRKLLVFVTRVFEFGIGDLDWGYGLDMGIEDLDWFLGLGIGE